VQKKDGATLKQKEKTTFKIFSAARLQNRHRLRYLTTHQKMQWRSLFKKVEECRSPHSLPTAPQAVHEPVALPLHLCCVG